MTLEERIDEMAKLIAPDYPGIDKVDAFEKLWAIECAYIGTCHANYNLHKSLSDLRLKLGYSKEQLFNFLLDNESPYEETT